MSCLNDRNTIGVGKKKKNMKRIIITVIAICICLTGVVIVKASIYKKATQLTIKGKRLSKNYAPQACIIDDCPGIKCTTNAVGGCHQPAPCGGINASIHVEDLPLSLTVAQSYAHTFAQNWLSAGIIADADDFTNLEDIVVAELTSK